MVTGLQVIPLVGVVTERRETSWTVCLRISDTTHVIQAADAQGDHPIVVTTMHAWQARQDREAEARARSPHRSSQHYSARLREVEANLHRRGRPAGRQAAADDRRQFRQAVCDLEARLSRLELEPSSALGGSRK